MQFQSFEFLDWIIRMRVLVWRRNLEKLDLKEKIMVSILVLVNLGNFKIIPLRFTGDK